MIKFLRKKLILLPRFTGPLRAYYNYLFGEKEIRLLFKLINKLNNDFYFFDIGANYGIYTFLIGRKAKGVFVFEPIVECINYIEKGFKNKSTEYINKVVSSNNEDREIRIPISLDEKIFGRSSVNNKFQNYESRKLQSVSLDSFTNKKDLDKDTMSVVKIDAEGHELEIIEGANNFLKTDNLLLLIEIEKRHNPKFIEVFKGLISLGFETYIVQNNNLVKLNSLNEALNKMSTNNNFIFKNF
tara:strand:- start:1409 stop:2134 length:726 start_codon:yes stop_codon:yes gene_type:complete